MKQEHHMESEVAWLSSSMRFSKTCTYLLYYKRQWSLLGSRLCQEGSWRAPKVKCQRSYVIDSECQYSLGCLSLLYRLKFAYRPVCQVRELLWQNNSLVSSWSSMRVTSSWEQHYERVFLIRNEPKSTCLCICSEIYSSKNFSLHFYTPKYWPRTVRGINAS